jgi:hypothetical protein
VLPLRSSVCLALFTDEGASNKFKYLAVYHVYLFVFLQIGTSDDR